MALFIPSKNHDRLNGEDFTPEVVTGWCMVNPHHASVTVSHGVRVMCDSGAFQEKDMVNRLTPDQALARQLAFEKSKTRDGRQRFPNGFAAVVTYDMLVGVDEAMVDGKRVKRRGTEETAEKAVQQTIASAEHYHRERDRIAGSIAYAAQGATLRQYMRCVRALLNLMRPGRDILALGGFCIIGMQPRLKPLFAEVCREVAPLLRRAGVDKAHVLGVCVCDALAVAAAEFAKHGIEFSTDSSGIEVNSVLGKIWSEEHMRRTAGGSSPWRKVYGKEHKGKPEPHGYKSARLSMSNIRAFARWLEQQGRVASPVSQSRPPVRPVHPMQRELLW